MHPHWWYFAEPAFALLGAIVLGIFILRSDSDGSIHKVFSFISIALLVGTALWLLGRYLKWATTHFVLTSQRVIYRSGFFAKRGVEIPIGRVNNVNFEQGIFERMVGAGDLLIESGGEDGKSSFTDIRHPDRVQLMIHSQLHAVTSGRGNDSDANAAMRPLDVADQLERLESMVQRGSLTAEEFDQQKRKLLGN